MEKNLNFGLIGYPLGHSMSKVIHEQLFALSSVNGTYEMIEVAPENLKETFSKKLTSLRGFNVTIPHKIDIIPMLDELSDRAELFGAVNTVDVREDKIVGHNTDCIGFLRALESADITLGGNVLLCGSGGVARMIAFETVLAGAQLTVAVRESDVPAAEEIKKEIEQKTGKTCTVMLLADVSDSYDLIVNGTPVGMYPHMDACPLPKEIIQKAGAAFDVIYNPLETKFVKYAKEAGLKYSGGLSMLVWQAAVAEEIWNDVKFSVDDIKKVTEITGRELTNNG